jgi:hypothetical protein
MNFRILPFLLIVLLSGTTLSGQYYDTGQDPSSVKWMQIKTDRFTVIYPQSYGAGGAAFAKSLDDAYNRLTTLFPAKKFRIPVIIHSLSTESNGYVAWAPGRMEIYPTPEQNSIPMDMNEQLALHELAHVFQMESLNQGFTKVLSVLLGEQAIGIVSSVLPLWFLEGDAVFAETYLSASGRGRNASFQKQVKAITVEKPKFYNYDKSINGSFRDYVPDHYQYGYQMATWTLANTDSSIWNRVLSYSARHPYTINPVNFSLKKDAELSKEKLFNKTFDTLKTIWTNEYKGDTTISYETLNPEKNGKYISYHSPVLAGKDSIIAVKTSLSSPPSFVLVDYSSKKEKRIHTPGQMSPWYISYAKGKLVWVEPVSDIRWENRDFSVIKLLDIKTKKTRKLSSRSRYLAVSISPDGKTLCAIDNTIENLNNLVFLDVTTGKVLLSAPSPDNCYLQRPQWASGGEKISVIILTEAGEGIMSYSMADKRWTCLKEPSNEDLQSTLLRNDSLFFISSRSGTDNIYLLAPDKQVQSVTRSRYGTSDLALNGNNLIFSDYSVSGNNIAVALMNLNDSSKSKDISSSSFQINSLNIKRNLPENTSDYTYTPEPYRKWQHPFRFHSWMPFYADLDVITTDPASLRPGFSILTQNNLSTLISTLGYEYSKEKNHVFHSKVTWKGLFPVLESQLDYGDDPKIYKLDSSVGEPSEIKPGLRFSNTVSFPMQFSSGKFSEFLRPSLNWEYNNKYIYLKETGSYDYGQSILSARLYFSNYHRSAMRDIYPRWAQVIDLNYTFAPFDKPVYGTAASVSTAFFFPGILPNNGIKLRFEKEKQDPSKYMYSSGISFPRGYNNVLSKDISFYSADYVLPLFCPDLSLATILYIKRIRGGLFYDYASATGNYYFDTDINGNPANFFHNYNETFSSYGFELLADFHLMRIPFMISAGFQTVWIKEEKRPAVSLLFNIDLFGRILGKSSL